MPEEMQTEVKTIFWHSLAITILSTCIQYVYAWKPTFMALVLIPPCMVLNSVIFHTLHVLRYHRVGYTINVQIFMVTIFRGLKFLRGLIFMG